MAPATRAKAGTKGVPRATREEQILDEACREFGTLGFAATNVTTVATRAGISKPLVYNYFGSKEGLYTACLAHAGELLGGEVERIARGNAVGLERGLRTLDGMFAVLEGRPYLWRLLHDPTAPATGPAATTAAAHARRISALADEGVAELLRLAGNDDPLDASALTAAWLGIVDALITWWVDHPDEPAAAMTERCRRLVGALVTDATRHLASQV